VERELKEIFSLSVKEIGTYYNNSEYVDDILLQRIKDFNNTSSFNDILEGHAKLLEHKSNETGFDLYGEALDEKEIKDELSEIDVGNLKGFGIREDVDEMQEDELKEMTDNQIEESLNEETVDNQEDDFFDFFDEDTTDVKLQLEKEENIENLSKEISQSQVNEEDIVNKYDRLDKMLKEMIMSNHAPTSDLAISVLSSKEYKDLMKIGEHEKSLEMEKMKKIVDEIMEKVEDGKYIQPEEKKMIVNVNELIDENTMVEILGKDMLNTLQNTLSEGILQKTLEDIENEPTTSASQVTDLLNSYFFVGKISGYILY
jgi:hypothetical protein